MRPILTHLNTDLPRLRTLLLQLRMPQQHERKRLGSRTAILLHNPFTLGREREFRAKPTAAHAQSDRRSDQLGTIPMRKQSIPQRRHLIIQRRGFTCTIDDAVGNQPQQLLLAPDVPVQRTRLHAELGRNRTHREIRKTAPIKEAERHHDEPVNIHDGNATRATTALRCVS